MSTTLFKLRYSPYSSDHTFVQIKLVDMENGKREMEIFTKTITNCMETGEFVHDKDKENYVTLVHDEYRSIVRISFTWLRTRFNDRVEGYIETVNIPDELFTKFLETGEEICCLYHSEPPMPAIKLDESAHKLIRKLDGAHRRALQKFFAINFQYPYVKSIDVYYDPWTGDFGWRDNPRRTVGGINPSSEMRRGRDGNRYPGVVYRVNT